MILYMVVFNFDLVPGIEKKKKKEMSVIPLNMSDIILLYQDLENQALTETEAWREQQVQLQEQQALQNRAKQEAEAEIERYKQVREEW